MLPALELSQRPRDELEALTVEHRPLTADPEGIQSQDAVEAHLARAALRVPVSRAQVEPDAPEARLVGGVAVVILAREHEAQDPGRVVPDDEHRAVLAARGVVLEGDPGPHDLARVRVAVEVRLVDGLEGALEVGAVRGQGLGHAPTVPRSRTGLGPRAARDGAT